jgi:hypothetical protein
MAVAPRAHGQWLRDQRRARGWNVPDMRRELREAAESTGDKLPGNGCLSVMIQRWEDDRSGISERYRLHYCRAFGIPFASFGKAPAVSVPHAHGSKTDDIAGSVLARLFGESPAGFPGQVPPGADLRTAARQLCDPANRDELCFLLGYATAMVAATRPRGTDQGSQHD